MENGAETLTYRLNNFTFHILLVPVGNSEFLTEVLTCVFKIYYLRHLNTAIG